MRTRPGQHSTTPLSAQSSYNNENSTHSSRVMGLPDVAENSPRVASERQHGAASDNTWNFLNIAVSEFYFWHTITSEPNMREAPNLERMVGGIHTVDRGFTHFQYHTSSALSLMPRHTCTVRSKSDLSNISGHMGRGRSRIWDRQSDCRRPNYNCMMLVIVFWNESEILKTCLAACFWLSQ